MSGQDFLRSVREHFSSQGWDTSQHVVQNGVCLLRSQQPGDTAQSLTLVVTEPETAVETTHIKYLIKQRQQAEATAAYIASAVGISDSAQQVISEYNIKILDQSDLRGRTNGGLSSQIGSGAGGSTTGTQNVSIITSDNNIQSVLKQNIGIFAIVGLGFGLTNALGMRFLMGDSTTGDIFGGLFVLFVFLIMLFSGPILGALTGVSIRDQISSTREAMITAFTSGTIGYLTMAFLGAAMTYLFMPSSDASNSTGETVSEGSGGAGSELFDFSDLLVPLLGLAIPVGIVAALVVYVSHWYRQ